MECDGCEDYLEQFRVTVRCVENIEQDGPDPTLRRPPALQIAFAGIG
jgi:hypothetical protein